MPSLGRLSQQPSQHAPFASRGGGLKTVEKQPECPYYSESRADKPAPKFWFGTHVIHAKSGKTGEIIGLHWRRNEVWFYCVDYTTLGYGQWFGEDVLAKP